MANPDPKALQAAAATMRGQAQEARKAFVPAEGKRDNDAIAAQEAALVQKHAAEQAVKDYQTLVDRSALIKEEAQKTLDDNAKKFAEAEKKGDSAALEELRESNDRNHVIIDQAQGRLDAAQRNLDQAKVTVAERTRDLDEATRRMNATIAADNPAEKQLDALEDKAKLLDEAGLKLELASTIDNPVERAGIELDAEKLLKQANAIQVDTAQITAITGQELQLPDIAALPPATEVSDAGSGAEDHSQVATAGAGGIEDPFAAPAADDGQSDDGAPAVGAAASPSTDDVLGTDAAPESPGGAVAATATLDPAPALDTADVTAFDAGSFDAQPDAQADGAAAMPDAGAAVADAGDFASSSGIDDPGPVDDGADFDV